MQNLEKAIICYQKSDYKNAIELAKNIKSKKAYFVLAESYFALKNYKKTIPYYECLLKNNIKDPWLANNLSQSYEAVGNYEKAIEFGFKSLEMAPENNQYHINFAYLLYDAKDVKAIKKWQKIYKENPVVDHFSSSLLGCKKKKESDLDYVKAVFDNFGSSFDGVLGELSYKAPQYIADVLKNYGIKKAKILDVGCGTGLCGKLIKKYADKKSFVGVDISSKMLDVAQEKNIYHHLIEDDILSYLNRKERIFDCVISSDVLTYFGELSGVFEGVFGVLSKGGNFVFTVSKNIVDSSGVFLHESGRFLHSENYVKKELKKAGFLLEKIDEKVLRFEGENPVDGYVILAQKKS